MPFWGLHVFGQGQVGRAGALLLRGLKGLARHFRQGLRGQHRVRPLGHGAEHAHQVNNLVGLFVNAFEAHLGGKGQQRAGIGLGVGHALQKINGPRPQRGGADARLAREPAIDVGHKGRTLLVPGQDEADVAGIGHGAHKMDVFFAGNAENVADALCPQAFHQQLSDVLCSHARLRSDGMFS